MDITDPEKAIRATAFFLPGFAALGLVVQVTDLKLNEFAFVYVAVVLSMSIYVSYWLLSWVAGWLRAILNRVYQYFEGDRSIDSAVATDIAYPDPRTPSGRPVFGMYQINSPTSFSGLVMLIFITGATSVGCVKAVETDALLRLLEFMVPNSTGTLATYPPMRFVLERAKLMSDDAMYKGLPEHHRFLNTVDKRPAASAAAVTCKGRTNCSCLESEKAPDRKCVKDLYSMMVRAAIDGQWVEGKVSLFKRSREGLPFEMVLSPACYLTADGKTIPSKTTPVKRADGPGFVLFEKSVKYLELVEQCSSACYLSYFPEERKNCDEAASIPGHSATPAIPP